MDRRSRYAAALGLLLALFVFRVGGQLIQLRAPVGFLPPFEAWHSATIPYGVLLTGQVILALVLAMVVWRVGTGRSRPSRPKGAVLGSVGVLYSAAMAYRLVAGLTFRSDERWFNAHLATAFHFVLAAFVLALAAYHLRGNRPIRRPD